jgi:hypothetical protein
MFRRNTLPSSLGLKYLFQKYTWLYREVKRRVVRIPKEKGYKERNLVIASRKK